MDIGIITCYANNQDMACSSFACLKDIYEGKGTFSRYNGKARLVGIINCGGCATIAAPEKLLKRVRSLTELHPGTIHLSNCMMNLCPFANRYYRLLESRFPHIQFIKGTHGGPEELSDAEHRNVHRKMVNDLVVQGKTMADMIPIVYQKPGSSDGK